MALSRYNNTSANNVGFSNHIVYKISIPYINTTQSNSWRQEQHISYENQGPVKNKSLSKNIPKPNICVPKESTYALWNYIQTYFAKFFSFFLARRNISAKQEPRFDFNHLSMAVNAAITINSDTFSFLAERDNGIVLSRSCFMTNVNIKDEFEAILSEVYSIRNLIIIIYPEYDNDFRKNLIKISKIYASNVKIIGNEIAEFLDATDQHSLSNFNIIWVLNEKFCSVWQNINQKVKCIGYIDQKMSLMKKDILHIKTNTVNKNPDIILFTKDVHMCECTICTEKFNFLKLCALPNCRLLLYTQQEHNFIALIKSKMLINAFNVDIDSAWEIEKTLMHDLKFVFHKNEVVTFERLSVLPLIKFVELKSNDAYCVLEVYQNNKLAETLSLPQFDEALIKISVDINGIYSAKIFNDGHNKKVDVKKLIQTGCLINHDEILKNMFLPKICENEDNVHAVGIDLGTTRCCAAVNRRNAIETVALDQGGERQLPSYVAYDGIVPVCGKIVIERLQNYSESSVFDTKRLIGKPYSRMKLDQSWPFKVDKVCTVIPTPTNEEEDEEYVDDQIQIELKNGEIKKYPEEISADLLNYIKQKVEEFQGKTLKKCVITIPAAFDYNQKKATISAAKLAGWENVFLLPESIAAVFGYYVDRPIPVTACILLFDLGGGTFEVCIFEIKHERLLLISRINDFQIGGRDFDNVLVDHFRKILVNKYCIEMTKKLTYKLALKCQEIKVALSTTSEASLAVDDFDCTIDAFVSITRQEFESLTTDLVGRIRQNIKKTLENVGLKPQHIDKVLHVGGGSRMPMIKNLLLKTFPMSEQCYDKHPDELVATGAAHYAYHIYPMDFTDKEEDYDLFQYANVFTFFWSNKRYLMVFLSLVIYLWLLYISPWKYQAFTAFLTRVFGYYLLAKIFSWFFSYEMILIVAPHLPSFLHTLCEDLRTCPVFS